MADAPIFIVGVPRSGTTLLAAMLAAHSRLSCGPETHFFRRLAGAGPEEICDASRWPDPAVKFIRSISHTNFDRSQKTTLLQKYNLDREQVRQFLLTRTPSIASLLSSVTEQYMKAEGKQRWIEKTPDHLEYVAQIRKFFPDSPIIRIVRDPRDIALSLIKVPWGVNTCLEAILYWKRMDEASAAFFEADPKAYTLRFEDLLSSPEVTLQKLCRFLEEDFEEGMLDTSRSGKLLNSRNVPWKANASQPIDSSKIAIWRREMASSDNRLLEAILGDRLQAYGYPLIENFGQFGEFIPVLLLATRYSDAVKDITSRGIRFWRSCNDEKPTATIFMGDPAGDHWIEASSQTSLAAFFSLLGQIIHARMRKHSLYWISEDKEDRWTGVQAFILKKLLAPHKILATVPR